MTAQPGMDVSSDDKLWTALAYVFTPLIPIILLLMEDKKSRPFIRAHNAQALAWGVVFYIIVTITSFFLVGLCIWPLGMIAQLYWAYKAYQGNMVNIPVITNFVKKQGWA
ncbi:MAG: hypothetical protein NTY23_14655 [Chloroflexi bacterium]|nr:hypothetical protein [Chloroflexota bacterium]